MASQKLARSGRQTTTDANRDANAIGDKLLEDDWHGPDVHRLIDRLVDLRRQMVDLDRSFQQELRRVDEGWRASARNLLHYVALRQNDIRSIQEALVNRGLSSLGRCESHVMANVNAVLRNLCLRSGQTPTTSPKPPVNYTEGRMLIAKSTERLFGENPKDRAAHIMVTMPTAAAIDYSLVRELVEHGMSCMRINCAHDDEAKWAGMIENLRQAERETGRACRVMMDLAGPKLRTGPLQPGHRVLKWRPDRDSLGRVLSPARIWFHPQGGRCNSPPSVDASVPLVGELLDHVQVADKIWLRDARGRRRQLEVVEVSGDGVLAESNRTVYVVPGTKLSCQLKPDEQRMSELVTAKVGDLQPLEQSILLRPGDRLIVTGDTQPGQPSRLDGPQGERLVPAHIGCTPAAVLKDVRAGERILFDDGKIGGVVEEATPEHLMVSITHAPKNGVRLRADKGINLPESELRLSALTQKDIRDLQFIVKHADLVAYSFVRDADDVHQIQNELARLGRLDLGIILKIENRQAFQRLPRLLLAALRSPAAGVMIARGDLAVECGYERMAELQEEILWMCEAAHMPVVWATQVLEGLAKHGVPSRAEVTDAAMGVRAECVMLNKGPHIVEALCALDEILRRMQDHQIKKRPLLRRLRLADEIRPQSTNHHGEGGGDFPD